MSAPTPEGLLKTAQDLLPSGPGRPSVAHLRRAISSAYYAVFCALCEEVGRAYRPPLSLISRRVASHSSARDVFNQLATREAPTQREIFNWLPGTMVCDPSLLAFGEAFIQLNAERERADYDHLWAPSKKDAEEAIVSARDAVLQMENARSASPEQVQAVCLAIVVDQRNRKRLKFPFPR